LKRKFSVRGPLGKHRQGLLPLLKFCSNMTSSVFTRKVVLCWSLAAAIPAVVLAQITVQPCSPSGAEYAPAGALPGDQTHPALSVAPDGSGGYLVYEDPASGIGAVGLDSAFSRVSTPFRINKTPLSNQLHPQVALLPNGGGAVFVWQAGAQGSQHVYARFLSPTNSWLTQDVPVNTFNLNSQTEPAIAALSNGNVVIVWNSLNQFSSGSMLDVYGQIFSPDGQKIGGEFLINQFTSYNQRDPAVAALPGGGFVVTWISEQQQKQSPAVPNAGKLVTLDNLPRPSVDVYARLFVAAGTPSGDEFPVNTAADVCANPRVAAGSDGGFVLVWSQKNTATPSASWDVFARLYSSSGAPGAVRLVNSHTYGDQYVPQVSALGTDYLAVWTSLGQDGSREGVYGQFLASDGSPEGGEFRVSTTTIGSQMQPCVASDTAGRFLVVWAGYVIGHPNFDLFGQRFATPGFIPPAVVAGYGPPADFSAGNPLASNSANPAGGGSSGSVGVGALPCPVAGPFTPGGTNYILAAGFYSGLFYNTNLLAVSGSGYFSATVTAQRGYSARFVLGSRTYSFSGKFDPLGRATFVVGRGSSALTVQLLLDLSGGDQIRGSINGAFSANIFANHQVFNKSTARAVQAGKYTLVIPADEFSPNSPTGDGFGAVSVDVLGNVSFTGALADGTVVSQKTTLSKDGVWPLYCPLYGGRGSLIGWIQLTSQPDSDLGGQMVWTKPVGLAASYLKYYPAGFTNNVLASGSVYAPPTPASPRLLDLGDGNLIFYRGGLTQPLTNTFNLDLRNQVTSPPAEKLKLSFTLSNGLFRGTTLNPRMGKIMSFQGALFQKGNTGVGFFLGPNEGGGFYLSPAP
jgi:hypothetical protein